MRLFVYVVLAAVLTASTAIAPGTASADGPAPISFTSQVTPNAVGNAVRIGPTNLMYYPRIAIDRDPESPRFGTVYVVGLDGMTCASIVVARSLDGGRSFGDPDVTDACLVGPLADIVIAEGGILVLASQGPTVLRSLDGGTTWENLVTLGTADTPPSLDWDPVTSALYVTWADHRAGTWIFDPGPVVVARSGDDGGNWTTQRSVLPQGVEGSGPQLSAYEGNVVVAFLVEQVGGIRVAAVASHDAGATWASPTFLSRADPCTRTAPSIAASDAGLFVISWYEDAGAHESRIECSQWGSEVQAFVSVSRDGGASFSAATLAGGPPGWLAASFGDAVVFDNASHVYLTWHSIAPGWDPATVHVAVSDDASAAFESSDFAIAMTVSGGNSTHQENLAAGPGDSVFLLWTAYSNWGAPEDGIFVRRVVGEVSVVVQFAPGVAQDAPIMVELRGGETTRRAWNGTAIVVSDVSPTGHDLNVTRGNATTALGIVRVRAWALHALVIRVGEPAGPSTGIPGWIFVTAAVALAGVVAYAYVRTRRARRPR